MSNDAGARAGRHLRMDDGYRGAGHLAEAGRELQDSGRAVARASLSPRHAGTDIAAEAVNAFVARYATIVSTQGETVSQTGADTVAAVRGLGDAGDLAARDQLRASSGFLADPTRLLDGRS